MVISGNITLMARATQMVWICSPCSGAMPTGSANDAAWLATGALAAIKSGAAGLWGPGALVDTTS